MVLCVRQEYFDGPELDRLILMPGVMCWVSRHQSKAVPEADHPDVVLDRRSPDCEALFKDLYLGVQVISPAIAVECAI